MTSQLVQPLRKLNVLHSVSLGTVLLTDEELAKDLEHGKNSCC